MSMVGYLKTFNIDLFIKFNKLLYIWGCDISKNKKNCLNV